MDVDEIEKTFARLEELVISMPRDPLELGPDYLREQISVCRGYLNEVSVILQRILREKTLKTIQVEALEAAFAIKADGLLTEDLKVKDLPSVTDRLAKVNNLLLAERQEISKLKLDLQSGSHVERVVRLRQKELDNTMSALRLQRSLLKDQLRTGSFYGDESPEGRSKDDISQMSGPELDALLAESEALITDLDGESILSGEDPVEEDSSEEGSSEDVEEPLEDEVESILAETLEDVDLQEEVDRIVASGGVDAVVLQAPPKDVTKRKGVPLRTDPQPIKGEDVDPDMQDFLTKSLEEDFDSFLDSL